MMIATAALALVGVSYVAFLLLADRYSPAVPAAVPTAPVLVPKSTKAGEAPVAPGQLPPGMIGQPTRAAPAASGGPVMINPNASGQQRIETGQPSRRIDAPVNDLTMKPAQPASVPETVNDDLSQADADADAAMAEAPSPESTLRPGAAPSGFRPMPGMSLDVSGGAQPVADPNGMRRQANLAAASERLGFQARPASDFSNRFNGSVSALAPAPVKSAAAVKPAAAIVTGSTTEPTAPDVPLVDTASETAELPPALVGPLSLRMAAAKGDPSAAFEVATRLAEGRGIKQDFKLAMTWYQRSANKGLAVAQYRLGTLYERGLGTPVDVARARAWYKRAADQGNVKAMHNMAVLSTGNGQSAPDYAAAAKWFKDAAERGLSDSQFNLGVLNENGLGVTKDPRAAYVWFSIAARGGDAEAVRRRDLLLASLDASTLKSADDQVKAWRVRPTDARVNDARVAGDQWRQTAQVQEQPPAFQPPQMPQAAAPQAQANSAAPAVAPRTIKVPAQAR
jgi:localization factor PodJL